MQFNKKTVFIALFAILYLAVCLVSTIHAVSFFGLANSPILGTILAVTFEIGQAAVLFNLLTSPSQRKRFMPWALMCILTLVQILGNIFSSYKYLMLNSSEDLRYFKEPIFVWTDLPDQQCNVIITYIVGAILPIVALCLTEMVVSYLGEENNIIPEQNNETIVINEENNKSKNVVKKQPQIENKIKEEIVETESDNEKDTKNEEEIIEQETSETNTNDDLIEKDNPEEPSINIPTITEDTKQAVDELLTGNIQQSNVKPIKASHFINI